MEKTRVHIPEEVWYNSRCLHTSHLSLSTNWAWEMATSWSGKEMLVYSRPNQVSHIQKRMGSEGFRNVCTSIGDKQVWGGEGEQN